MLLFSFGLTSFLCGAFLSAAADAGDEANRHPATAVALLFGLVAATLSHYVS